MIWYLVSSIFMALGGAVVYIYYFNKGQFDELEDVKYQILRDDEEK